MKILMIAHTLDEEGSYHPGEVIELRDQLAEVWIKNGWALRHMAAEPKKETQIETPERKMRAREKTSANPVKAQ